MGWEVAKSRPPLSSPPIILVDKRTLLVLTVRGEGRTERQKGGVEGEEQKSDARSETADNVERGKDKTTTKTTVEKKNIREINNEIHTNIYHRHTSSEMIEELIV